MKIKSSVLFGLIVVIFSISGFSLLKRLTRDVDEWRPSDLYSTTNVSRRSTYSVVSSGASASYSGAVPSVSSGASSMFRHRGVSSYAPAMSAHNSLANSQYSIGGTPSNSVASPMYATSSAEFRSFGGGGNAGGVSMSGGSVRATSSQSSIANIQLPIANIQSPTANTQYPISNIQSPIASNYQGIGNTTTNGPRAMRGRRNLGIDDENVGDTWLNWLAMMGTQYGHEENGVWVYDVYELRAAYDAFCASWNFGMGKKPTWDEWLDWFMGSEGNPYKWSDGENEYGFSFVPVGDYTPLFVLALLYVAFVAYRRRQLSKMNCEKQ